MYIYLYTCIHDIPLCTSSASLMITLCTVFIFTELGVYLSLRLSLYSAHTTHVDADNDDKDGGAEALKDYETPNAPPHIEFVETAISCVGCRMHAFGSEEAPASSSHAASSLSSHAIDAYTRPQHTAHTHTHSMRERNSVEEEVSHWHTRFVLPHLILSSACRAPRRNRCSCTCTWGKPWREYTFSRTIDPPRRNLYIYIYIRHALPPLPPIISFPSIPILSHCSVSSCLERARKKVGHTHEHIYIYMSHSCVPSITQRVGFQHVWRGMLLRISSS